MPIIVKDFTWNETLNTLTIQVPLHGVHQSKVDIFHSKGYLKASFEHFFFEVFLFNHVDPYKSIGTIMPEQIVFELIKVETQLWNILEKQLSKCEKNEQRKLYIEEEHQRIQKESSDKKAQKCELKRVAVREQIALDTKQREEIDSLKELEKKEALHNLKASFHKQKFKNPKEGTIPVRSSRSLTVCMTPREFPLPIRESRIQEENEWLRRQAEARRSVGFVSEDLRAEEKNPQFLKDKGDEFMKNNNYLGAISAYTFGIKLSDKLPDLFIGRAGAHLAIGNYHKTVQDSSSALDLLKPAVKLNLTERALCIGRRGIGLIKLGMVKQGIGELEASLRMVPDETFQKHLDETKSLS